MVDSSFASLSDDNPVCNFDNCEISVVELGVLMLRVGGSPRDSGTAKEKGKRNRGKNAASAVPPASTSCPTSSLVVL